MTDSPAIGTGVITGASRGIGAVSADRLAKRGYDLIPVARSAARLGELAACLKAETGRSVTPLPADLSDRAGLATMERALQDDQRITMLVNNAGIGSIAPLHDELRTAVGRAPRGSAVSVHRKGLHGLKRAVADLVVTTLEPIRQRYLDLSAQPEALDAILAEGAERARVLAALTLDGVKRLMGLDVRSHVPFPPSDPKEG